ncbi:MAG: Cro/CI family transcriptional regulator [Clostridia bacterium]|nr:Cro/CI family transcriptional regulator [Clostridia bacterium]
MNRVFCKGTALALVLLLAFMPLAVWAEPDFDPGTLYATLLEETFEGGRLIEGRITLQANALPFLNDELKGLEEVAAELIGGLELRFSAVDDYDQKLYSLALFAAGREVAAFHVREDAQSLRVTSNLLPGMTFSLPAESLSGQSFMENEDVVMLVAAAYLTYFARIAAWVSETESETEDLYVHEFLEESEDTDTRDAVERIQRSRVRSEHFKPLLRNLADTFYIDEVSQQALANLLQPLGVTQADVRRWADELPLLIAHQLEVTDAATEFAFFYDDEGDVIGFDGVMPALLDPFFFEEGSLTYSRKTNMDDVRHAAQGQMLFGEGRSLSGDLQITYGENIDDMRQDEMAIGLVYTDAAANGEFRLITTQQDLHLAQTDLDTCDSRLVIDVFFAEDGQEEHFHFEKTAHGETKPVGELDFAHSTVIDIDLVGVMSLTVRYEIGSSEYVSVPWEDVGQVYDLSALTDAQTGEVMAAVTAVPFRLSMFFLAALPPEVMQGFVAGE